MTYDHPEAARPEDEADALTPEYLHVEEEVGIDDPDLVVSPDDPDDDPDRYVPRDGTAIYE